MIGPLDHQDDLSGRTLPRLECASNSRERGEVLQVTLPLAMAHHMGGFQLHFYESRYTGPLRMGSWDDRIIGRFGFWGAPILVSGPPPFCFPIHIPRPNKIMG